MNEDEVRVLDTFVGAGEGGWVLRRACVGTSWKCTVRSGIASAAI
jgi:hypothetical protein